MNELKLPKALIVSAYLPEAGVGGGAIFRDLLKNYPAQQLLWFAMEGPVNYLPSWRNDIKRLYIPFFCPGRLKRYWDLLETRLFGRFLAKIQNYRIQCAIKSFKPDLLWLIAQKKTVPLLHHALDTAPQIPVHISIHDDPILENSHHPFPYDNSTFARQLNKTLERASSIDSVSDRLLNKYKTSKQAGAIVTRGIEKSAAEGFFAESVSMENEIKIVLGGMGQSPSPWPEDLMAGIRLLQSKVPQKVTFHAFDFTFPDDGVTFFREPMLKLEEFDQALKKFHIGYICDPMNDYGREFAATSFSTKLVTYVTHGLPFIYHGPQNSTTADFLQNHNCGRIVESHNPEMICDTILAVIKNYAESRQACKEAVKQTLNLESIRSKLFNVIRQTSFYQTK